MLLRLGLREGLEVEEGEVVEVSDCEARAEEEALGEPEGESVTERLPEGLLVWEGQAEELCVVFMLRVALTLRVLRAVLETLEEPDLAEEGEGRGEAEVELLGRAEALALELPEAVMVPVGVEEAEVRGLTVDVVSMEGEAEVLEEREALEQADTEALARGLKVDVGVVLGQGESLGLTEGVRETLELRVAPSLGEGEGRLGEGDAPALREGEGCMEGEVVGVPEGESAPSKPGGEAEGDLLGLALAVELVEWEGECEEDSVTLPLGEAEGHLEAECVEVTQRVTLGERVREGEGEAVMLAEGLRDPLTEREGEVEVLIVGEELLLRVGEGEEEGQREGEGEALGERVLPWEGEAGREGECLGEGVSELVLLTVLVCVGRVGRVTRHTLIPTLRYPPVLPQELEPVLVGSAHCCARPGTGAQPYCAPRSAPGSAKGKSSDLPGVEPVSTRSGKPLR